VIAVSSDSRSGTCASPLSPSLSFEIDGADDNTRQRIISFPARLIEGYRVFLTSRPGGGAKPLSRVGIAGDRGDEAPLGAIRASGGSPVWRREPFCLWFNGAKFWQILASPNQGCRLYPR
jgi:hypothetical protein